MALTEQEACLLRHLAAQEGQTVSRDVLFREVLGYADGSNSRALDAAIRRIRHKIEADPSRPVHLLTVYGVGYRLSNPVTVEGSDCPPAPVSPSLPRWDDVLVGRDALLRSLVEEIESHAVVTLHGPGGVGKTRLACEALRAWAEAHPGGGPVHLVTLRRGVDAVAIAEELAASLGLAVAGDPRQAVALATGVQPSTLLLDGAEVAVAEVAALVAEWRVGGMARIVVTSREPLAVPGERIVSVPPLEPEAGVELLRARAQAARGGQPWTSDPDEPELMEVAAALDGLPLALELAASRALVLTAAQLRDRLEHRFEILRRVVRKGPPRHSALESTIAWSWDLLDDEEQQGLVRLSVLQEPFPFETAEALLAEGALPLVSSFVAKSLLEPTDAHGRLRMLDSIRAFVRVQAADAFGEVDHDAHQRLAAIAHRVPLAPADRLLGARLALGHGLSTAVFATQSALHDCPDPREAIALAERGRAVLEGDELLMLGVAVVPALVRQGTAEGLDAWIDTLSSPRATERELDVEVQVALGQLLLERKRVSDAVERLDRARALTEGVDEVPVLNLLGRALLGLGDRRRALQVFERSRALATPDTAHWTQASYGLAWALRAKGTDLEQSRVMMGEALRVARSLGNHREVARVLGGVAGTLMSEGRWAACLPLVQERTEVSKRSGHARLVCQALYDEVLLQYATGEGDGYLQKFHELIRLSDQLGDRKVSSLARAYRGQMLSERLGRHDDARRDVEQALVLLTKTGCRPLLAAVELVRARVVARAGDQGCMAQALEHAFELLRDDDNPSRLAEAHITRARLTVGLDQVAAGGDLQRAADFLTKAGHPLSLHVMWLVAAGWVAFEQDRFDDVARLADQAVSAVTAMGLGVEAPLHREVTCLREVSVASADALAS
ncbi:MAG: winged helix-turn-helix domain-containing protein [Myxococcales bacterium]|nr:winged helix-turn-helix domain-containing protein [Myxococcales bacterium]